MNFTFYPWGNAYYNVCDTPNFDKEKGMDCWINKCSENSNNINENETNCFNGEILCQHGVDECWANRLEGCAIKHYPTKYLDFLICFEGMNNAERSAVDECAKAVDIDANILNQCESGTEGHRVDQFNAMETIKLGTSKIGTPWVIVNGKPMEDPSQLLSHVCSLYQGSNKPEGCN
jgi:interferon gamma-inducible protein 30